LKLAGFTIGIINDSLPCGLSLPVARATLYNLDALFQSKGSDFSFSISTLDIAESGSVGKFQMLVYNRNVDSYEPLIEPCTFSIQVFFVLIIYPLIRI